MSSETLPIQILCPAGIGDFSWVYSKIRHLSQQIERPVHVLIPCEYPMRSQPFIEMLEGVRFGGYCDVSSRHITLHGLPPTWLYSRYELTPFTDPGPHCLAANVHLEAGGTLADWLPFLPTDYHYPIAIPKTEAAQAEARLAGAAPRIGVYVSGRHTQINKDWALWTEGQWATLCQQIATLPHLKDARFVLIGADYDAERTEEVQAALESAGHPCIPVLGESLGVALAALAACDYLLSYPSGIGIVANVLKVPTLMLLPDSLRPMEMTYADPEDLASGQYRAWANPRVEDAWAWFQAHGYPHLLSRWQARQKSGQ